MSGPGAVACCRSGNHSKFMLPEVSKANLFGIFAPMSLIRVASGYACGGLSHTPNTAPYCESTATTTMSKVWIGSGDPTGVLSGASLVRILIPGQRIWMNAVPIAWQSTDESNRARATRMAQTSSTASSGSREGTTSVLSMGAKVAIGVCVPLAAIGAALLASFLFRKRKSNSKGQGREEYLKVELPGDTRVSVAQDPNEMDATGEHIVHVPYNGPPVELPAQEMRYAG
jgi:hypothetical protein